MHVTDDNLAKEIANEIGLEYNTNLKSNPESTNFDPIKANQIKAEKQQLGGSKNTTSETTKMCLIILLIFFIIYLIHITT